MAAVNPIRTTSRSDPGSLPVAGSWWRRGPLRSLAVRLTLVVAGAMALLVASGSVWRTWHLFSETMTEIVSNQRLALAAIPAELGADPSLVAGPDEAVHALLTRFEGVRHISVRFAPMSATGEEPAMPGMPAEAWFAPRDWPDALVREATFKGTRIGSFFVMPRPADEIEERHSLILADLIMIGVVTLALTLLTFWAVRRAMRPLARISEALTALGAGDPQARLAPMAISEFDQLPADFNRAAAMIRDTSRMREKLTDTLIEVEETTRRRIAHDLHDELSPYLVAIQPNVALLQAAVARDPVLADYEGPIAAIGEHVARTVQRVRLMLETLHPPELETLGLLDAIAGFCESQRLAQPRPLRFTLHMSPIASGRSEAIDTTLFRAVQESVTNAIKHGACNHIGIMLRTEPRDMRDWITLRVWNDGRFDNSAGSRPGLGTLGLRDRVEALNGCYRMGAGADGQWQVEVTIPAPAPRPDQS
ncbi:MAG: histidine kinase [Burkholderiaceae bacterium]